MSGLLSVVATPIGNLDDLSPRAAKTLERADVIACEDTRVTAKLLSRLSTHGKLLSYRSANERERAVELADEIARGRRVALVTDAGTPGVSDPGHPLVDECVRRGLRIEVIPGPSAAIAALVVSGLPTARFVFEGFLPHTRSARLERLRDLAGETRTLVLFEAPHRIEATLEDIAGIFGDRRVAMAREMTKIHEEIVRTTICELLDRIRERGAKGEITLVIEGADPAAAKATFADEDLSRMVDERVARGASKRDAVEQVSIETGEPRNRVYRAATGG